MATQPDRKIINQATVMNPSSDLYRIESGAGAPLLLIHGTGFSADVWASLVQPLSLHRRVIAYDRRGFGRSTAKKPSLPMAFADHAKDAHELLAAVAPGEPAVVIGWSSGGIVALHLAATYPESVRALVLIEPSLRARQHRDARILLGMTRVFWNILLKRSRPAAVAFFRTVTRYRDGSGSGFDALPRHQREALLDDSAAVLAEMRNGTGEELSNEQLNRVRCPVALLLGTRSAAMFAALGRDLARVIPQLHTIRIEQSGHIPMVEAPEALLDAIVSTLVTTPAAPGE